MITFFVSLTALLTLFTLVPLARIAAWPVRVLDFPRLQIAVLWVLLTLALCVFMDFNTPVALMLFVVSLACLSYQLWWILPYTRLYQCEVKSCTKPDQQRSISIVTANVLTPNRNAEALLKQVRHLKPDLLVTLESDQWWQDQLDSLSADYPHSLKCPLDNLYGMHLYSKLTLQDAKIEFLVEDDKPSMHTQVVLRSGDTIRCHFLHPAPPSPTENSESSERDAELLVVARSLEGARDPIIVTGDLNDVAWSRTTKAFRRISRLLDPRIGRGMFNTFHAKYRLLRWPLDHVFHSDHFTLINMQRLKPFGSDHFALFTELAYTPRRQHEQNSPTADANELELARDKISEQQVSHQNVPTPGQ
ncbi:endonuclease/exonuclease/phosphatase family protein [Gilvimarinus polysaccharolyticus]|uniref:endonuclease/exonuclease/phosphatase family protein n=1 Tax=Gilvimarinus polysaccharolyticus TaxID=863921 RepID=UPI00067398E7|nr:endonuclease/exonuclease/phosphatase family protein [Gilvimarinus polysaccharolyticus]